MIGGLLIPILIVALPLVKDAVEIGVAVKQFNALPSAALSEPPVVPFCRPLLGTMNENQLNEIELVRALGDCR